MASRRAALRIVAGAALIGSGLWVEPARAVARFEVAASVPLPAVGKALAAADFDGDGRQDVATVAEDGTVTVALAAGGARGASPAPIAPALVVPDAVATPAGALALVTNAAAADFDSDAIADLLVSGSLVAGGCGAVLMQGLGDGSFAPGKAAASVSFLHAGCTGLEVDDFDGDGAPDFALGYVYQPPDTNNGLNGGVDISLGDGSGGFGPPETHLLTADGELPYYAPAMTRGDFDGDGAIDLAFGAEVRWLSGPGAWRVQTLRGNGAGQFVPGGARDFTCVGCDLVAATGQDHTGDGVDDVVLATRISVDAGGAYEFPILFFAADGVGAFAEPVVLARESAIVELEPGDVTADGIADVVVVSGNDRLTVLAGDGTGQLVATERFLSGGTIAASLIQDLDADGRLDLAILDANRPQLRVARGSAPGTAFALPVLTQPPSPSGLVPSLVDWDADGVLDVLAASYDRVDLLRGTGNGRFETSGSLPVAGYPWHLPVVDVDGDGALDLVLPSGDGFAVLSGLPGGGFPAPSGPLGAASREIFASTWGDADGDGDGDLAVFEIARGVVDVYLQDAGHALTLSSSFPSNDYPSGLAFVDLDRDGAPDLFIGDSWSNYGPDGEPLPGDSVIWFGDAHGAFGTPLSIDVAAPRILLVDVNADGALDLATPDALRLGHGDGTFEPPRALPSTGAHDIALVDLDGDGRLDLASLTYGALSLAYGDGAGSFGEQQVVLDVTDSRQLLVGHVAGSRLPDLVAVRTRYDDSTELSELLVVVNESQTCL